MSEAILPIPQGAHTWLWMPERVRDWHATFEQAKKLGFVGVHLHTSPKSLKKVLTPLVVAAAKASGIYLGASMGCDGGNPWQELADTALYCAGVLGSNGAFCFNWEIYFEKSGGKVEAQQIVSYVQSHLANYNYWDAPWWYPTGHPTAPTDEFGVLMKFRIPQTYYVTDSPNGEVLVNPPASWATTHPTFNTPPQYMVETARSLYAKRSVQRPLAWGFPATSHLNSAKYIGLCMREYPVQCWWHYFWLFDNTNLEARQIFHASYVINSEFASLPTYVDRVKAYQGAHGLVADGLIGPKTAATIKTSKYYDPSLF